MLRKYRAAIIVRLVNHMNRLASLRSAGILLSKYVIALGIRVDQQGGHILKMHGSFLRFT